MTAQIFHYNLHGLLNLAAGFFNIAVGVLVLRANPRAPLNRAFFLFTFSSLFWVLGLGLLSLAESASLQNASVVITYFGVPFLSPLASRFGECLRGRTRWSPLILAGHVFALILTLTMAVDHRHIYTITDFSWGRYLRVLPTTWARFYYGALLSCFSFFSLLTLRNLFLAWRSGESPSLRTHARNVFFGFVFLIFMGSIDFAVKLGLNAYPFGYLCLTILILVIAYNIGRHQFLNINLLLKKATLAVIIYSFLLSFLTPFAIAAARTLFGPIANGQVVLLLLFIGIAGLVLSTGPMIYATITRRSFWLTSHVTTGLTHELKSPVGAIMGAVELVIDQVRKDAPNKTATLEYAEMIRKNGERLESFVKDLLQVARIQDGLVSLEKRSADLSALAHKAADEYRSLLQAKNISLSIDTPETIPIEADTEKIRQVFSNLLSNAVKFSRQGTIRIKISVQAREALTQITDDGCGIPEKDLEHVFERFYQGRHGQKGAGIGLAIAKAWVEAHGGKIWAESDGEGKGTTVTFTVPVT